MTASRQEQFDYAMHLVACADTVVLSTCEEVQSLVDRAYAGEFDSDIEAVNNPDYVKFAESRIQKSKLD